MAQTHVGIDVSKRQLDVAIRGRPEKDDCLAHDAQGIEALCQRLTLLAPDRIVVGPLPQLPAHGLETTVRLQGHRHRILAAVVGQQRALQPQGQDPLQAALKRGQMPLELAAQGIQ